MLNLLPKKEKEDLKRRLLNRYISFFGLFLIAIILFLIAILVAIYSVLYLTQTRIKQSNVLFTQAQELEKQVSSLNKDLADFINQRLEYINKIEKEKIYWSQVLEKLTQTIPNNIRLSSLEIDEKVKIAGYAKTRDDLILLQKILEREPQFKELESPLSNFVKQQDIDFFFAFKILKQ